MEDPKFCLEKNGDTFHLKQDHAYYYQVRVNFKVFNYLCSYLLIFSVYNYFYRFNANCFVQEKSSLDRK